MSAPQYRPVLERHPFCKDFGTPQLERLAALARPVAFAPEEVVFRCASRRSATATSSASRH